MASLFQTKLILIDNKQKDKKIKTMTVWIRQKIRMLCSNQIISLYLIYAKVLYWHFYYQFFNRNYYQILLMYKNRQININQENFLSILSECDVNPNYKVIAALKQKQPCISQVLYTAMEESGIGLEKLQKVFFMVCDEAKKNKEFARWIAPSLKQTYVKIRAAKICNIQREEILKKLLLCQELDYYEWDEPKDYLEAIGKILKLKEFSGPDKLKNMEEAFQDQQWRRLRDLCGEIHEQERKKCLRVSKRNAIKKRTDLAKQSELDRTIFQHLLKSFEAEHLGQNSYTSIDFQSFKGEMEKLTGKLGFKKEHIDIAGEVNLEQDEQAQMSSQQPSFFYNKILALKNQLYPIYIPRLVELLEQDSKALSFLASKRVIAFLGSPGAGKSTFAQMALGYRFRKMKDKRLAIEPISEQHRYFVDPSNKGVKYCEGKQYQNSYLVDMPAFYNLDDKTAEIASILKIKRLLYYSEFSLPVFVFNFREWGSDDHVFKNFCRKVSIFFEKGTPQVLYAFSNVRKQETETLIRKIKNFKLSEAEKGDTMLMNVVNQLKDLVNQIIHDQKYKKKSMEQLIKDCPRLIIISNPCTFYINEIIYKLNNPNKKSDPKKISITLPLGESEAVREATEQFEALARSYIKMDQTEAALFYANCLRDLADKTKKLNDVACAEKRLDSLKKGLEEEHEELLGKFTDCLKVEPSLQSLAEAKQYEDRLLQLDSKCKQLWFMKDLRTKQKTRNAANGLREKILGIGREEGELERTVKLAELFEKHFGEDKQLRQQIENLRSRKRDELERKYRLHNQKQEHQSMMKTYSQLIKLTTSKQDNQRMIRCQQLMNHNFEKKIKKVQQVIKKIENSEVNQTDFEDLEKSIVYFDSMGSWSDGNLQVVRPEDKNSLKQLKNLFTLSVNDQILKIKRIIDIEISTDLYMLSKQQLQVINRAIKNSKFLSKIKWVPQFEKQYKENETKLFSLKTKLKKLLKKEYQKFRKKDWSSFNKLCILYVGYLKICFVSGISFQQQTRSLEEMLDSTYKQIQDLNLSFNSSSKELEQALKYSMIKSRQLKKCKQNCEIDPSTKNLFQIVEKLQAKLNQKIQQSLERSKEIFNQQFQVNKLIEQAKVSETVILNISKCHRFANFLEKDANSYQLKNKIDQVKQKLYIYLKNAINSLKESVSHDFSEIFCQKVKKYSIDDKPEEILTLETIKGTNSKRAMLLRIFQNKQSLDILKGYGYIPTYKLFFHHQATELKSLLSEGFKAEQRKGLAKCIKFVYQFQILMYLDSIYNQNNYDFRSLISSFKAHIADAIKIQNLSCEPSTFIKNNQIDTYQFRRVHSFLSKFGPETKEALQKQLVMDAISGQLKRDEDDLQRLLLRRLHKQRDFQPDGLVDQICLKAESLLRTVTQLQDVVKETEEGEMSSHFISDATMEKISNKVIQIVDSLEAEIRSSISEGGEGQKRAEQYIKLLAHVQRVFNQLKVGGLQEHVKEKLEDTSYGRELHQYLAEKLSYQKKDRYQRYIQSDQIIFDDNLWKELEKIKEPQRNRVVLKIAYQIEQQLEEILTREEDWDRTELRREIDEYKREMKTKKLPIELKVKTEAIFERFQKKLVEQQQKEKKYIQENFKIEEAIERIGTEKNPKRLEVYKRQAGKYFEKQLRLIKQINSSQQLISCLDKLLVKHFEKAKIKNSEQLKKIYDQLCEKCCILVDQNYVKKLIQKLKNLCNNGSFNKKSILDLKKIIGDLLQIWDFLGITLNGKNNSLCQKKLRYLNKMLEQSECFQKVQKNWIEQQIIKQSNEKFVEYFYCHQYMQVITNFMNQSANKIGIQEFMFNYKQLQLEKLVSQTINQLMSFTFYSQSMKNISDHERMCAYEKIDNCMKLIASIDHSGVYDKNLRETSEFIKKRLEKEIQNGIQNACGDIKKGFSSKDKQFSKQINLTIGILQSSLNKLKFFNLNSQKRREIYNKIEEQYDLKFRQLEDSIQDIKKILNKEKADMSEKQKFQKDLQTNKRALLQKSKEQQQKLEEHKKRELNAEHDGQKQNQIRKRYQNDIQQIKRQTKDKIKELQQKHNQQKLKYKSKKQDQVETLLNPLIIVYIAKSQLNYKQQYYQKLFTKTLKTIKESLGKKNFNKIYESLEKMNNNYANILINQHQVFKHNQAQKWTAKVRGQGIDYVLSNLNISHDEKEGLKEMFVSYTEEFEKWTKAYSQNPNSGTIQRLISSAKQKAKDLTEIYDGSSGREGKHPEKLLADIYALWTITKSDIEEQMVDFYYQPHPAQVVSVFLCLSFLESHQTEKLQSKMAQIGTGQGKSVVLAGLSSYLAMCGFEVDSVCYSGYLSGRDGDAFKSLFQKLGVDKKINYGTFENLCQSLLNRKTGEYNGLRQQVKAALEEDNPENSERICQKIASFFKSFESKNTEENKKIMLIDQVDVFFDPSFFGSVYRPSITLQSSQISQLLRYVWTQFKKNKLSQQKILNSTPYNKIINKYMELKELFQYQIRGMIHGCQGCDSPDHTYVVQDDLIQYKDQDGLSSKISYGFKTLFAYMKQNEKKRISDSSLQKALKINLIIAKFSYALLPSYFKSIIGVTGTYHDLSNQKKAYMNNFNKVKSYYVIPSVYGSSRRRVIQDPLIQSQKNFLHQLFQSIKAVHQKNRPVLVFFKTGSELDDFYQNYLTQEYKKKTTFLKQTHNAKERDNRIKKTCNKNNITLMTSIFGRGTDFMVYDESIFDSTKEFGGLHVIQTFLSLQSSQQIQIQGRTARQGNPGSYRLIISQVELENLKIQIKNKRNFNRQIGEIRKRLDSQSWVFIKEKLAKASTQHNKCIQSYVTKSKNKQQIVSLISSMNYIQEIKNSICKTIIMVDGTGSMGNVFLKLKQILQVVMNGIIDATSKYKDISTSEIQLCVYRNYNSPSEKLFQHTPFQNSPENLIRFLRGVNVEGGWGNQAIQMCLCHINNQEKISQVIIIGDAACNSLQQITKKRQRKGQKYWKDKGIPLINPQEELKKIKIPIHSFYIKNQRSVQTQKYFQYLSKQTKGHCEEFLINRGNASEQLLKFITQKILNIITTDKILASKIMHQIIQKSYQS